VAFIPVEQLSAFIGHITVTAVAGIVITISIGENGDVSWSCKRWCGIIALR
jgi:hypothetical protein